MNKQFDLLIDRFIDNRIGIDTGFISQSLSKGLRQKILQLQKNEMMNTAGIGNGEIKDSGQKIRSDKIYWMDKAHPDIYEQEFLQLRKVLLNT